MSRTKTRQRQSKPGSGGRTSKLIAYAFLVVYSLWSLFPLIWILLTSFKTNVQALETPPQLAFTPTFDNYPGVFERVPNFGGIYMNSLVIAAASTAIIIVLAVPAGYGISRFLRVPRGRVGLAIMSARTFPGISLAIPLFLLMQSANLLDTHMSVIAANVAFSLPFAIWMAYGFIEAVPIEIEDAARVDGCTHLGVLARIVVPLILPGIGATAVLVSIVAWREFLFPFVLTSNEARTLPVLIGDFITQRGTNWGELSAYAMMTILPVIIFGIIVGKYLVRGFVGGGVKG